MQDEPEPLEVIFDRMASKAAQRLQQHINHATEAAKFRLATQASVSRNTLRASERKMLAETLKTTPAQSLMLLSQGIAALGESLGRTAKQIDDFINAADTSETTLIRANPTPGLSLKRR